MFCNVGVELLEGLIVLGFAGVDRTVSEFMSLEGLLGKTGCDAMDVDAVDVAAIVDAAAIDVDALPLD